MSESKPATQTRVGEPVSGKAAPEQKGAVQAAGQKSADPKPAATTPSAPAKSTAAPKRQRKARLRLIQVDAWSVMKMAFLLSIAIGIVTIVAVVIIWIVLGAAGVFDSLNNTIQTVMGNDFRIQDYIGTGRIVGFTMLVAAVDVILLTAIATLTAFLYNLAATLLGGVDLVLAEDR